MKARGKYVLDNAIFTEKWRHSWRKMVKRRFYAWKMLQMHVNEWDVV